MKFVVEDDYAALSRTTAAVLVGAMLQDRRVNLSVTAGATPAGAYRLLAPLLAERGQDIANVHFYNFDEIPNGTDRGVTRTSLDEQIYGPARIAEANIHGLTLDNADAIRSDLATHGGLDLMVMGLGGDCHFCGNMPGTTRYDQDIYVYDVHADLPWYHLVEAMDPRPEQVVTFGFPMVLRAKQAVLIVSGSSKAQALAEILTGPIGEDRPGTILRTHPNLLLIADREAAALVEPDGLGGFRRR
ncbi:6-phosphogluconolactonase [Cellulomonas taurus]|uniref:6-phosphogluconolactonase n=1 Tax=Cellulomonas taurus TaxID=2729175 RepID=UPI00145DF89D|nr:6-phosphogluconolactonase [Cellulomonas taurus]